MQVLKEDVKQYWNRNPCEAEDWSEQSLTLEYFDRIAKHRYATHPYIAGFAQFHRWEGQKILEIGVGAGTDFCQWTRAKAYPTGIDLTPTAVKLTRVNLELHKLSGRVLEADVENLPFADEEFDLVYSFGVLHHTPNTEKAIQQVMRVLKPGGHIRIMLYNNWSWVSLRTYLEYIARTRKFHAPPSEALANIKESPGTKAYSQAEVLALFRDFDHVAVKGQLTTYDLWDELHRPELRWRIAHAMWPRWLVQLLGDSFGWNWLISGSRPNMRTR